jgi:hypothetical protein
MLNSQPGDADLDMLLATIAEIEKHWNLPPAWVSPQRIMGGSGSYAGLACTCSDANCLYPCHGECGCKACQTSWTDWTLGVV